ncbi:MAG: nucleotide exchange factor GrpE [Bacteroidota bacterium]
MKKNKEEENNKNTKQKPETDKKGTDNKETNKSSEKKQTDKKSASGKSKKELQALLEEKEQIIEELNDKFNEINEKYMRLSAEFDNYRKRTLKEKMDMTKSAGSSVILNILPAIDDFERAMNSIEETDDVEAVKKGMELIYNKLTAFLKQEGVEPIEAVGKEFNTDEHEAMTKIPAPSEDMKGKVVEEVQKGYKLNDQIIRHSKVVVGE